jgi:hypothetical protein
MIFSNIKELLLVMIDNKTIEYLNLAFCYKFNILNNYILFYSLLKYTIENDDMIRFSKLLRINKKLKHNIDLNNLFLKAINDDSYNVAVFIYNKYLKCLSFLNLKKFLEYGLENYNYFLLENLSKKNIIPYEIWKKYFHQSCILGNVNKIKILLSLTNLDPLLNETSIIKKSFLNACCKGNTDLLELWFKLGFPNCLLTIENGVELACLNNKMKVIKFFNDNDKILFDVDYYKAIAKKNNCIDVLNWLEKNLD